MEIWKDVKGYEGLYQVSNYGNVLNFKRGTILKTLKMRRGYDCIHLSKNDHRKTYYIHRLVAINFIDNPFNYPDVNHKDECKTNNYVDNLEWCTTKYNSNYGTGVERRTKKLSVKCIGVNIETGKVIKFNSMNEAGRNGFSATLISKCIKGIIKKHKGYIWECA